MIQLADFVAGSLARIYDPKKFSSRAEEIHEVLRQKALYVLDWPKRFRSPPPPIRAGSEHDDRVRRFCLERVQEYLREHPDSEDYEVISRIEALQYLLYWYEDAGEDRWMPTGDLREYLGEVCAEAPSVHQVRSKIIAPLRDSGVIVASSEKGYKIPACVEDVLDFVARTESIVVPMLNRVSAAREAIRGITDGALDVLADERFQELRRALDGHLFPGAANDAVKKAG